MLERTHIMLLAGALGLLSPLGSAVAAEGDATTKDTDTEEGERSASSARALLELSLRGPQKIKFPPLAVHFDTEAKMEVVDDKESKHTIVTTIWRPEESNTAKVMLNYTKDGALVFKDEIIVTMGAKATKFRVGEGSRIKVKLSTKNVEKLELPTEDDPLAGI